MRFIEGEERDQIVFFPDSLDRLIDEDNPVRFIDEFAESLDYIKLGFKHARGTHQGRPPYRPPDITKLLLYGYYYGIRSSRKLERECTKNVEVMWLLRNLKPDFKTIADFRKDNPQAIKETFRTLVLLLRGTNLLGGKMVGLDSTKLRAQNAKKRAFTRKRLEGRLKEIDQKIEEYLEELDQNDELEKDEAAPDLEMLRERLKTLKERKKKYEDIGKRMDHEGVDQVTLTDPECRIMKMGHDVFPAYSVQTTVDSKEKIIMDFEVVNDPTDVGSLLLMALRAKEVAGKEEIELLADKGYFDVKYIAECEKEGIIPYIPRKKHNSTREKKTFDRSEFSYDPASDTYTCPAGSKMTFRREVTIKERVYREYGTSSCPDCELKERCIKGKAKHRRFYRGELEEVAEAMDKRLSENKEKYRLRQCICEHPFGTLKRILGYTYLLVKGKEKAGGEVGLMYMAYNIKRAINILGTQELIAALA